MCSIMCFLTISDYTDAAMRNTVYLSCAKLVYRNGVPDSIDRTEYFPDIESYYKFDYPDTRVYTSDVFSSYSDLEYMLETGHYVFVNTHGSDGKIAGYDINGNFTEDIGASDFSGCSQYEFTNVRCCVLLACYSAKGNNNVCKAIYSKGARCVIGFETPIEIDGSVIWQKYFTEGQGVAGWGITQCLRYAERKLYQEKGYYGGLNNSVVYGDTTVTFGR